eukprot:4037607-Pleurochrysis_carterae.AAC.2
MRSRETRCVAPEHADEAVMLASSERATCHRGAGWRLQVRARSMEETAALEKAGAERSAGSCRSRKAQTRGARRRREAQGADERRKAQAPPEKTAPPMPSPPVSMPSTSSSYAVCAASMHTTIACDRLIAARRLCVFESQGGRRGIQIRTACLGAPATKRRYLKCEADTKVNVSTQLERASRVAWRNKSNEDEKGESRSFAMSARLDRQELLLRLLGLLLRYLRHIAKALGTDGSTCSM